MNLPSFLKSKPPLEELQRRDEYAEVELSLAKKKALIRELEARGGKDKWKEMSDDGKKSGINFSRIASWLRTH
jgi:hypothetical protein